MTIVVQDDDGTTAGANAYVDVGAFRAYHDARGNANAGYSDQLVAQALVRATDYLDTRFDFVGTRRHREQTTAWPRATLANSRGGTTYSDRPGVETGVPDPVKRACCEYALRALSTALSPDPVRDETGRVRSTFREKVGPLETEAGYGGFELPRYPAADALLRRAGLVVESREIVRG